MKRNSTIVRNLLLSMVLLSSIVLLSCNGKSNGYTIKGVINSKLFSPDSIFLYDETGAAVASAPVTNNKFELKGSVEQPQKLMIGSMKAQFALPIIVENADFTFELDDNYANIKGGKIHDIVLGHNNRDDYKKATLRFHTVKDSLESTLDLDNPAMLEEANKILDKMEDEVFAIENKHFSDILEGNYPTLTKLFALNESQDWKGYPLEKRLKMLDEYEKERGKHQLIDSYREYLTSEEESTAAEATVAVGNAFKNITTVTREKESIELATIVSKNKYTLLEFWASWCGPCRAEIPNMKQVYEKYKSKGFEIYAVSLDDKEKDWLEALDEEKTPWLNLWNTTGFKGETVLAYGVKGVPSSYLIDKDGKIVASLDELRGENLSKTLEKLLK